MFSKSGLRLGLDLGLQFSEFLTENKLCVKYSRLLSASYMSKLPVTEMMYVSK